MQCQWFVVSSVSGNKAIVQIPPTYDSRKSYPLILLFHGRGCGLTDNNFTSDEWSTFRELAASKGFIIAVPDYGSDSWMNEEAESIVVDVLSHLKAAYSVDSRGVFLLGVSMGGGAALTFATRHPDEVAAVCDLMGVTDFDRFYGESGLRYSIGAAFGGSPKEKPEAYNVRSSAHHLEDLKNVPVLIIHGEEDEMVPIWNSEILYDGLTGLGASVRFKRVPRMSHQNTIIIGLEHTVLDFLTTR